jgi:hypothetical protein
MPLFDRTRFIGCRSCGQLLPLPHGDTEGCAVAQEEAAAAHDEFRHCHAAHDTAEFIREGSTLLADRPLWDPLARVTFEITDGARVYLVTAERSDIDEPRTYRFTAGRLTETATAVDVAAHDLERALDREFYPLALRRAKVDRLLRVLQDIVRHARLDDLDLDDAFDDVSDPAVSIAPLPEPLFDELVRRCTEIFEPSELDRVLRFLEFHRSGGGLLTLRVRRELTVVAA